MAHDPTNYWFVAAMAVFLWVWLGCFAQELDR